MNAADEEAFIELLAKARVGERRAVSRLILDYRRHLLWVAKREMDAQLRLSCTPEEVVQQSLLWIRENVDQFRGSRESEWRSWVSDVLRKEVRRRQESLDVTAAGSPSELEQELSLPKRPSSATAEALREQRRLLSRAIEQLEPRQRQVIELREFDRLSFESVGLRMGLSADATRKLHRRAMEVLQQLIESHHASSGDDPCSPQPPQT